MPAYINLIDSSTNKTAAINADGEVSVALTQIPANAGYARMLDGNGEAIHVTDTGALLTSGRELIITETVDGSNLNTNKWVTSVSGMTVTQASGFITLNAGSAVTANAYAILRSIKNIPLMGSLPALVTANIRTNVLPQSNLTMEWGFGTVATNAAPTDGCYFRWNANGNFQAIINNGAGETIVDSLTPPAINNTALMEIEIVEDEVAFFIDDIEICRVVVPIANAYPTNAARLPVFLRVYNGSGSPAVAPQIALGQLTAVQQDVQMGRDWKSVLAAIGQGAYQSPITPFTQTAQHDNSTTPTAASLSNTTPSYSTLGGRFLFNVVSSAATDYALFGYQVPAGYQLYITGISISGVVSVALGLTASILKWSLGVNGSAASLATAESPPTSWATRRIPIGTHGATVSSIVGTTLEPINIVFPTPLVVDSGRYAHVILQTPVSSSTGTITGEVMINGYQE